MAEERYDDVNLTSTSPSLRCLSTTSMPTASIYRELSVHYTMNLASLKKDITGILYECINLMKAWLRCGAIILNKFLCHRLLIRSRTHFKTYLRKVVEGILTPCRYFILFGPSYTKRPWLHTLRCHTNKSLSLGAPKVAEWQLST